MGVRYDEMPTDTNVASYSIGFDKPSSSDFNSKGHSIEETKDHELNSSNTRFMDLPMNTLFEILKRLSVNSVGCIRCVSKTLTEDIIDSPFFIEALPPLILRIVTCFPKLFFESMNYNGSQGRMSVSESMCLTTGLSDLNFVFQDLVCFSSGFFTDGEAILANPLRGEVMRLPNANKAILANPIWGELVMRFAKGNYKGLSSYGDVYGICYDDITSTYKIVRVSYINIKGNGGVAFRVAQVLVLGSSLWMEVPIPSEFSKGFFHRKKSVCAYGDMHWLYKEKNRIGIITLDFVNEELFSTPKPVKSSSSIDYLNLITYKGAMTIVDTSSGISVQIWVMKNYKKKQWKKKCTIMLESDLKYEFHYANCLEWEHGIFFINYKHEGTILLLDLERATVKLVTYPLEPHKNYYRSGCSTTYYGPMLSLKRSLFSLRKFGKLVEDEPERTKLSNLL